LETSNQFLAIAERKSQYNASEPLRQLRDRLTYLQEIGLDYLSLDRPMHTLSSGEAQRVNLTTILGSSLVDMLYVFDEPTVGLHPQDIDRVGKAIRGIRDRGNTVILVEHEPAMIRLADRVIEIGPGAGAQGGESIFDGTPKSLAESASKTGHYLRGQGYKRTRTCESDRWLTLRGATGRNLKGLEVSIPIGCMTVVTGPSGAGKSSLILETLVPALQNQLVGKAKSESLPFRSLEGQDRLSSCMALDHTPIARSSRSTPATYCKAWDEIRSVFAELPESRSQRLTTSHFSFNSELGRCPHCEGLGYTTVEMQFMADIELECSDCHGLRFRPEILEIRYRDRSLAEILDLGVEDAYHFFRGESAVQDRLNRLREIGLGYLPLGQRLSTLSAGESMRLKLSALLGLSAVNRGEMVVMDEPTTGLHFEDIERLVHCFEALLERGRTIVVIEHNEQMIEAADYRIDLGPGGGPRGGELIFQGWQK
jgi:excinuclease ABC subunit A